MRRFIALSVVVLALGGCAKDYGVHGPYLYGDMRSEAARNAENDGWISKCEAPAAYCPPATVTVAPNVAVDTAVTVAAVPPKKSSPRSAWN